MSRRIAGDRRVELEQLARRAGHDRLHCGSGSRSTSELSSTGVKRTGTSSISGSFALTTNHNTTDKKQGGRLEARTGGSRRRRSSRAAGRCGEPGGRSAGVSLIRMRPQRAPSSAAGFGICASEQLGDQRAVALRVPVVVTDPLLPDRAFAPDDERLGIPA